MQLGYNLSFSLFLPSLSFLPFPSFLFLSFFPSAKISEAALRLIGAAPAQRSSIMHSAKFWGSALRLTGAAPAQREPKTLSVKFLSTALRLTGAARAQRDLGKLIYISCEF